MPQELTTSREAEILEECQEAIGYHFRQPELLRAALTHASGANTRLASNERLEFLGDAVLGLVCCEQIERDLERIVARAVYADSRTQWTVNERPCDSLLEVGQVLRTVAEIDRSLPVILDVAGEVPLGDMIDGYDLCRLVGFEKIQFAAQKQTRRPGDGETGSLRQ